MAGRKGRNLNPQERALWERVAHTATPLERRKKAPTPPVKPREPEPPAPEDLRAHVRIPEDFSIGTRPQGTRTDVPGKPDPLRMDKKRFQRMTKGKLQPEARIDLHGMTLADAHPALTSFVLTSYAAGRRLVLVITGKGRAGFDDGPIPSRPGVLRRQVPLWLSAPPLSQAVLQVTEASRRHGGSGAYYVYLRRGR